MTNYISSIIYLLRNCIKKNKTVMGHVTMHEQEERHWVTIL